MPWPSIHDTVYNLLWYVFLTLWSTLDQKDRKTKNISLRTNIKNLMHAMRAYIPFCRCRVACACTHANVCWVCSVEFCVPGYPPPPNPPPYYPGSMVIYLYMYLFLFNKGKITAVHVAVLGFNRIRPMISAIPVQCSYQLRSYQGNWAWTESLSHGYISFCFFMIFVSLFRLRMQAGYFSRLILIYACEFETFLWGLPLATEK